MMAFNDNTITDVGRCDISLCTPKPVPFQHGHHLHRQQTLLYAHQKPGIKTPECNEPSPMNIHVLYLTIVILKLPVPHFT
jgi:hypothetical protein